MDTTLTQPQADFDARIAALGNSEFGQSLRGIRRGVERETLRINADGTLAQTPHPQACGAALTHSSITTDFSESLMEFITPPEENPDVTLAQLRDIHKFVAESIGEERLWPVSMPCYVRQEQDIPLAYFGESNVGKMKRIYRVGLKNRYGSLMQAIAGVHYNFSIPQGFWQHWQAFHGEAMNQDAVSANYFSLIRNFRRHAWMIPYLFGASPALCGSFLQNRPHNLPFEKMGKGTYYLPYATSLRMSDLGYTSSEQAAIRVCYNSLDNYVRILRQAMYTPSEQFAKFAAGEEGHYQQLSKNILQIENEFYSPMRPKQPTESMEKPTDALARRGVSYVEVRVLDVNPFSEVGISAEQMAFLDVFLVTCLLLPSPELTGEEFDQASNNFKQVVTQGRMPGLTLNKAGEATTREAWSYELFDAYERTAQVLDDINQTSRYSEAVTEQRKRIDQPDLTLSGQLMQALQRDDLDNGRFALQLSKQYKDTLLSWDYHYTDAAAFAQQASDSLAEQREIEQHDTVSFDEFIQAYYSAPPAKKNA